MLAAISPAAYNYEETLNTLQYADRAKAIVLKARKNETMTEVGKLKAEIEELKAALAARRRWRPGGGGGPGGGVSPEMQAQMQAQIDDYNLMMKQSFEEKERMARARSSIGSRCHTPRNSDAGNSLYADGPGWRCSARRCSRPKRPRAPKLQAKQEAEKRQLLETQPDAFVRVLLARQSLDRERYELGEFIAGVDAWRSTAARRQRCASTRPSSRCCRPRSTRRPRSS